MKSFLGFLFGVFLCLILSLFAGESPTHVLMVLLKSAFGSKYDLGLTLFYTTSLIFTGLSVCIAFYAGMFNIGAEGQLIIATLATAAVGILFPNVPSSLAPLFGIGVAIITGGLWGFIPGILKAKRGSHEVIITMMMNFIAAGIASYYVVGALKSTTSQNPESEMVSPNYLFKSFDPISQFFQDSPANLSLLIAIFLAVALHFFLFRSIKGFEIRALGQNEEAASVAGISGVQLKTLCMTLAGAFAGLVATNEILGSAGKFQLGFSPEYGFIGIAVALMARNRPLRIIFTAFLFGALQKGASDLDLETNAITRDFAKILQAVIILSVISFALIPLNFEKVKKWIKKQA
ncbi:MAG: ABC transporter permease [Oligoflexia bacterium]|nr:MAG: ABC transporter permease [Oligoflexia bacterium]